MRICDNCGASNSDFAKFCNECAAPLAAKESVGPVKEAEPSAAGEDPASLARSIASRVEALQRKRSADVLFVLDCTGSMQGEIDAIKDAITSFADTIEKDGVRVRVGLVEFRDRLINEEHRALAFEGSTFTKDPAAFRHVELSA
jgi:hypothetical protein